VARVSIDFRADRIDRIATIECASCSRTWRRSAVPPLASAAGYQSVRLTLILPSAAKRWFARRRWRAELDGGIVIREATIPDLDEAAREHRATFDRHEATRERARAKRAAAEADQHRAAAAMLARLAESDAARAADEAAAAAREAA
jgi:hypothetical protein